MAAELPRMYAEFSDWFHVQTAPDEYAQEAGFYLAALTEAVGRPLQTILEVFLAVKIG